MEGKYEFCKYEFQHTHTYRKQIIWYNKAYIWYTNDV